MKIFISYRRDDSAGYAGRLFDHLTAHFGIQHVFMDVDTIQPGEDFRKAIENAVGSCDVVIVMMGRQWLNIMDAQGKRRLDDPQDFVRAEVASALASPKVRVIPVLVRGAGMPSANDLPDDLKNLAWRNAIELSDSRFQYDADKLIAAIEKLGLAPVKKTWVGGMGKIGATTLGGVLLGIVALGLLLWMVGPSMFVGSKSPTPSSTLATTSTSVLATSTPTLVLTTVSANENTVSPANVSETPTSSVTKFFDNFDHGIDSTIWQVNLKDWLGTNGMVSAAQIYQGATMFIGDKNWQDYKISVNTSSSNGERTSYVAAVYVRYQDKDNYVQFVFNCNFPESYAVWQYKQNGNFTEINTTKRGLSTCKLEPYILQLSVRGTEYEAMIDGEDITFSRDLFKNGMVGLSSGENGGNASAAFDNFLIEP